MSNTVIIAGAFWLATMVLAAGFILGIWLERRSP